MRKRIYVTQHSDVRPHVAQLAQTHVVEVGSSPCQGKRDIAMKLVFPNGEHAPALLAPGGNRIGSSPHGAIVLRTPSMPALAAEIHMRGSYTNLVPAAGVEVLVNNHPVRELITLRVGDRLRIAGIQANVTAVGGLGPSGGGQPDIDDDAAQTRMMAAMPRYLLRGLTGAHFGKLYPLIGNITIGRTQECEVVLPFPEISRSHVQLRPAPGGVMVEDLESSNGIWVNDQRMQRGLMRPGDELRLDTHRFLVCAPGSESASSPRLASVSLKPAPIDWNGRQVMIAIATTAAMGIIIALLMLR